MQIQAEACKYKIGQENNKTSNAKQDPFLESPHNFAGMEGNCAEWQHGS